MYGATFMNVMLISLHLQYFKEYVADSCSNDYGDPANGHGDLALLVGRKFDHRNAGDTLGRVMLLTTIGLFFSIT